MALTLALGRVQPIKRTWLVGAEYEILDFVEYNGSYYTCVANHTAALGNKPGVGAEWSLVAAGLSFQGDWINQAYDFGSTVLYSGNSYVASAQIATDDGAPDSNGDWVLVAAGLGSYRGEYNAAVSYEPGDFVRYRGSMYRANQGVLVGQKPTTNAALWETVAFGYNGPLIQQLVPGADASYEIGDLIRFGNSLYVVLVNLNSASSNPQSTPSSFDLLFTGDNHRGSWEGGQTYYAEDVVEYGNGLYRCTAYAASIGDPRTNSGYWRQLQDGTRYAGAWALATDYYVGDVVTLNGSSYLCTSDHTSGGTEEPTASTQTRWTVLAGGVQYEGLWVSGESYNVGSVVHWGSTSYIANRILNAETVTPDLSDGWDVLVSGYGEWTGDWSSAATYRAGQVVSYVGSLYRASAESTTQRPSSAASDWELITRGSSSDILDFPDLANGDAADGLYFEGQQVRWHGSLYRVSVASVDTSVAGAHPAATPGNFQLIAPGRQLQGEWVTSRTYYPGDLVYRINNSYLCTATTIPNSDGSPENLPAKWQVWSVGQRYRGTHDGLLTYFPGDVVTYANSLYQCKQTVTSGAPTNTTYWDQLIEGPQILPAFIEHSSTISESFNVSPGTNRMYAGGTTFSGEITVAGRLAIVAGPANFTGTINVTGTLATV